jgi:hypothetical protein
MSGSPVFFFLVPQDQAADDILTIGLNARFRNTDPEDGSLSLRVGLDHQPRQPGQLISFGRDRSRCDVVLPAGFSARQCHFFIHPRTGEVILRDDSINSSTSLLHLNESLTTRCALPDSQPRQRVVPHTMQEICIRMHNAVFMVFWCDKVRAFEATKTMPRFRAPLTVVLADPLENGQIVHQHIHGLGQGATAEVFKTLNLKTGDHLAVKIFKHAPDNEEAIKRVVRIEVELISQLSHVSSGILQNLVSVFANLTLKPNIAVFKHAQGWQTNEIMEIFMEAYSGTLWDLLDRWKVSKGWHSLFPTDFSLIIRRT